MFKFCGWLPPDAMGLFPRNKIGSHRGLTKVALRSMLTLCNSLKVRNTAWCRAHAMLR